MREKNASIIIKMNKTHQELLNKGTFLHAYFPCTIRCLFFFTPKTDDTQRWRIIFKKCTQLCVFFSSFFSFSTWFDHLCRCRCLSECFGLEIIYMGMANKRRIMHRQTEEKIIFCCQSSISNHVLYCVVDQISMEYK